MKVIYKEEKIIFDKYLKSLDTDRKIIFDRKQKKMSNGLVLGTPGIGKSFHPVPRVKEEHKLWKRKL